MRRLLLLIFLTACKTTTMDAVRIEEGRRLPGSEVLHALLDNPSRRAEAARAMGRIQSPEYRDDLLRFVEVEPEAIFALGQLALGLEWRFGMGKPVVEALRKRLRDSDPEIRILAVEALGKLGALDEVARMTVDRNPGVRAEAALAIFRCNYLWKNKSPDAREALEEMDGDWEVACALQALAEGRSRLEELASKGSTWARMYAVRGLGKMGVVWPAALKDPEYIVRVEAVRAHKKDIPEFVSRDSSFHVRAAYASKVFDEKLLRDSSVTVRGEAIVSLGRALGHASLARLRDYLKDADWRIRVKAAEGLGESRQEVAVTYLHRAVGDDDRRVTQAVASALAKVPGQEAFDELLSLVRHPDVGVRWMALEALVERNDPRAKEALIRIPMEDQGIALEPWVEALAHFGAKERLREIGARGDEYGALARKRLDEDVPHARLPSTGYRHAPETHRVKVLLRHEKGEVILELDGAAAPEHVANAVALVKQKYYDGLEWHRVVSNFVIQGGDANRDGFGDPGYRILDEINRLRHVRGTVGLSKMIKDTGDSQFYITHVPTPHLDGRYTVFGRVVKGMEVVDSIEAGDRILEARVLD